MGLAPSRRSPQQSIADRTTYVGQQTNVCISAHFVVILVGDAPRLPPERPLAWSPASSQLLHEGRELGAVHLDGLREAGLQDGSVFAEPVSTSLPLLLLFPVVGQDFAMLFLNRLQLILVLGYIRQQFVNIALHICPPVVHQSGASMHHSDADIVVFIDGAASF